MYRFRRIDPKVSLTVTLLSAFGLFYLNTRNFEASLVSSLVLGLVAAIFTWVLEEWHNA